MVSDCRCFLEQTKRSLDLAAGAHARCRPTRACPDPEAFDPLFDVYKNVEPSNDSRHLKDRDDIELFFGLTDSLAMLVLMETRQQRRLHLCLPKISSSVCALGIIEALAAAC